MEELLLIYTRAVVTKLLQAVALQHLQEGETAIGIANQVAKQTAVGKGLTDGDALNICTWLLEQNQGGRQIPTDSGFAANTWYRLQR